jgi:uncharacterized protein (DUF2461 family)
MARRQDNPGAALPRPQQLTLIGAYLFGSCPVTFIASAEALKKAGLLTVSRAGNLMCTPRGYEVARALHRSLSQQLKARFARAS